MTGRGPFPGSGRRDNGAVRSQGLRWRASTTGLLLRSCSVTRTGRLRWPGPLRPWLAPCSKGLVWRTMCDRPGRGVLLGRGELRAAPHRGAARPAETVPRRVLLAASRAWNLSLSHGLLVLLSLSEQSSHFTPTFDSI